MAFAILSRKVLLRSVWPYSERTFGYALVVVSGEDITAVIEIDEGTPVEDVTAKYPQWTIGVHEHAYVLPGLVDLQVRCNGDWGNAETESRAAVSGGVTFFLEEPSVFQKAQCSSRLYCDVGLTHVLTSSDPVREFAAVDTSSVFAVKAYMSAPSAHCAGVKERLAELVRAKSKVPLLIDCFLPADSSLRVNSPFRLNSLDDREHEKLSSRISPGDGFSNEVTPCVQDDEKLLPVPVLAQKRDRKTSCSEVVDELFKYRKLKGNQESYEVLSKISLLGYNHCGVTNFQVTSEPERLKMEVPAKCSETLRMRRRPSAISVLPVRNMEMDEYMMYYGQYPEDSELSGVNHLISCLQGNGNNAQMAIHVTNLCSAAALASLVDYRGEFSGDLTMDTGPHYLFWTQDQIDAGNTRFKVTPPIRCRENQLFLWKLLRAGGIDTVSSHHTSVSLDYKFLSSGSFKRAVSGMSSLGFTLLALLSKASRESVESLEKDLLHFSLMTSTHSAVLAGVGSKRGAIEKTKYADLVILDPFAGARSHPSLGKSPELCPFTCEPLCGEVLQVFVRGQLAFSHGECHAVGRLDRRSAYA